MLDLLDALQSLPERDLEVAWLKYDGFTDQQIADMMGVHRNTVVNIKRRVRLKLCKFTILSVRE